MRTLVVVVLVASCNDHGARDGAIGGTDAARDDAGDAAGDDAGHDGSIDGSIDASIDAGPGLPSTSGSRLKLQWVEFDGNRTSPTIHDSVRSETCQKERWADGRLYCTPPARFGYVLDDYERYGDAQCQNPLAVDFGGDYAAIGSQRCGGEVAEQRIDRLYRLGAPVHLYWDRRSDGTCVGPFEDDFFLYQPTTEVPLSELVPLEREIDPEPGRLARIWLTSADGLRFEDGVHDRVLDRECAFESEEQLATTARCVPVTRAASHWYFADAACTRPAIVEDGCSQPAHARQSLDTRTHCALEPEPIHVVGPPSTIKFERQTSPPYGCVANTTPQWVFHELGAELAVAQASRQLDASGPRITTIRHVFEGRTFDDRRLYDRELDMECAPGTSFGGLRCALPEWSVKYGYEDATCQTPVTLLPIRRGPASCDIPKSGAHITTASQTVWKVGAPYTGAFYEKPWTTCVPRGFASDEAHLRVTQVPSSVLATGTVVIDQ